MDKVPVRLFEYKLSFFLSRASCPADFNRRCGFVRKRLKQDGGIPAPAVNNAYSEISQYMLNLKKLFEKVLIIEGAGKRKEWYSRSNPPLSRREIAVAALLSKGYQAKQIAEQLQISALTAERHIANIYKKMNIHRRSELGQR